MNREETKQLIIETVKETFTVVNDNFIEDTEYGYIEMSTNFSEGDYRTRHTLFGEKLAEALNKKMPGRVRLIYVDSCDTVEDILNNNFVFSE